MKEQRKQKRTKPNTFHFCFFLFKSPVHVFGLFFSFYLKTTHNPCYQFEMMFEIPSPGEFKKEPRLPVYVDNYDSLIEKAFHHADQLNSSQLPLYPIHSCSSTITPQQPYEVQLLHRLLDSAIGIERPCPLTVSSTATSTTFNSCSSSFVQSSTHMGSTTSTTVRPVFAQTPGTTDSIGIQHLSTSDSSDTETETETDPETKGLTITTRFGLSCLPESTVRVIETEALARNICISEERITNVLAILAEYDEVEREEAGGIFDRDRYRNKSDIDNSDNDTDNHNMETREKISEYLMYFIMKDKNTIYAQNIFHNKIELNVQNKYEIELTYSKSRLCEYFIEAIQNGKIENDIVRIGKYLKIMTQDSSLLEVYIDCNVLLNMTKVQQIGITMNNIGYLLQNGIQKRNFRSKIRKTIIYPSTHKAIFYYKKAILYNNIQALNNLANLLVGNSCKHYVEFPIPSSDVYDAVQLYNHALHKGERTYAPLNFARLLVKGYWNVGFLKQYNNATKLLLLGCKEGPTEECCSECIKLLLQFTESKRYRLSVSGALKREVEQTIKKYFDD